MLTSSLLVASMASVALGAVANICVEDPFRQMQGFRDFELAMSRCATHYSLPTITKTLPNNCLTSTKTVIVGTSTVHATSLLPCITKGPHLEMREAAGGNSQAQQSKQSAQDAKNSSKQSAASAKSVAQQVKNSSKQSAASAKSVAQEVKNSSKQSAASAKSSAQQAKNSSKQSAASAKSTAQAAKQSSKQSAASVKSIAQQVKQSAQSSKQSAQSAKQATQTTAATTTQAGPSIAPRDLMDMERRAGPTPVAVFKRDAEATRTAEWSHYYARLAECGYDCIQTACSCIGTPKVELRTPVPTCTSILTKKTVVHETKTIEVMPSHC